MSMWPLGWGYPDFAKDQLLTDAPMPRDYIRTEARAGRMKVRLMAIVAEGKSSRVYLPRVRPRINVSCGGLSTGPSCSDRESVSVDLAPELGPTLRRVGQASHAQHRRRTRLLP